MADTLPIRRGVSESSESTELEEVIEALSSPRAYPRHVASVHVLQTHISVLFFTEDRVYKLKKPVELKFLDFRAVEDRRRFCEEEVRLNRRLAAEIYLGVLPVTREADGEILVEGRGHPIDWVVEMIRLPAERMLDVLLEKGEIERAQLERVAVVLARFHAGAEAGPEVNEHGLPTRIAKDVHENLDQLQRLCTPALHVLEPKEGAFLDERMRRFLEDERELVERRLAEQRIREGHGDLHAGNICLLGDDVLVYDCVEFDRGLRCGDVAADLAFLAMDLDHRDHAAASDLLVELYAHKTSDSTLPVLVDFYKVHRALVRAKVQLLTYLDDGLGAEERAAALRQSRRYAQLAMGYELPPALILTCGLPGTGKSHLAQYVASRLRATWLRSDVVRREGRTDPAGERTAYGQGRYSPRARADVYHRMLERASADLARGSSVVVDATFSRRDFRRPFLEEAARLGKPVYVLHVQVSEAEARARIQWRARQAGQLSEADLEVYRGERERFESPDEVPPEGVLQLTGAEPPEQSCARLLERMIRDSVVAVPQARARPSP
jgi:aminoglycoside phosphotransferase family enzyme/predicted kinase